MLTSYASEHLFVCLAILFDSVSFWSFVPQCRAVVWCISMCTWVCVCVGICAHVDRCQREILSVIPQDAVSHFWESLMGQQAPAISLSPSLQYQACKCMLPRPALLCEFWTELRSLGLCDKYLWTELSAQPLLFIFSQVVYLSVVEFWGSLHILDSWKVQKVL